MSTVLTSTGITFPDATSQTTAAKGFTNFEWFSTSGTWSVPSTPSGTLLFGVVLFGGGGGGGGSYSYQTGPTDALVTNFANGSRGGWGFSTGGLFVASTGFGVSYTVGAGGAGTNTLNAGGGAGGTTTCLGMIAGGGSGGSGANIGNNSSVGSGEVLQPWPLTPFGLLGGSSNTLLTTLYTYVNTWGTNVRPNGAASTAALTWSSALSFRPGSPGSGETHDISNASGGYSGAVLFMY